MAICTPRQTLTLRLCCLGILGVPRSCKALIVVGNVNGHLLRAQTPEGHRRSPIRDPFMAASNSA
jgi:hypothetical protein